MARKKMQEPEKWITVNGQHLPVYPGGVIGQPGQEEPKKNGKMGNWSDTTSRNADDIYNERKNIKGNTQEEATRREKLSEELSRTVVSGMKSGEVYKVPSGKGYEELRYVGSEMKNNRAYATFETPNKSRTGIVKEGSDLYGIQSMKSSQPATTSRNARYDTSRTPEGKVAEAYKNVEIAKQAWRDAEQNKLAISKRLRNEYLKKNYGATYSQMEKKGTYTNKIHQEVGKYVMSVPEFKQAYATEKNAMNKHVSTTAVLKQEYEKYLKLGGIKNADWYKASHEWDDED